MFQYFIRRLLWAIVMILLTISVVFAIFFIVPGGAGRKGPEGVSPVAVAYAGKQPTPEVLAEIEERFGLDDPIYVQYGRYVWNVVQFWDDENLGYSYQTEEPVKDAIFRRLPATISLAVGASILWLFLGVSLGVISALHRRTFIDRASMFFALAGVSMPTFWLGLIVVFFFDATLNIYDTGSYARPTRGPGPVVRGHVASVDGPRHRQRRLLHADGSRQHAGGRGRGLHPHGEGQGPQEAGGDPAPAA